jgi:superfamily II DNA or RNA helicase
VTLDFDRLGRTRPGYGYIAGPEKYKATKDKTKDILSKERYPVVPNGKFVPYAHQGLAVGVILNNPFASVLLSCGTGKTGSTSRAVELQLESGEISKGSVLVSAPLLFYTLPGEMI